MAVVTIKYFGMEGTGRNVTEAKKDAGRKIEEALTADYTPEIFNHRGFSVLLYRNISGWNYSFIRYPDTEEPVIGGYIHSGSCCPNDTRKDTVKRILEHLAQNGWKPEDGDNPPDFLKDARSISQFKSWAQFQLRYREAQAKGMNDQDSWDYAARNPARAELWLKSA